MRPLDNNQGAQPFLYPYAPKGSRIYPAVTETKHTRVKYGTALRKRRIGKCEFHLETRDLLVAMERVVSVENGAEAPLQG